MSECKVCDKEHSFYFFQNKPVCFRCDELSFDIEIESDEIPKPVSKVKIGETVKQSPPLKK